MLCGRGRMEALALPCPTAGAGLNSWYPCYHKVNVTWTVYCLLMKCLVYMVFMKRKVHCIWVCSKKSWIHWEMLNDIVTCLWKLNVWYLKAVEMVRVV